MKVAAVQLNSQADVEDNLRAVAEQVGRAAAIGAGLVVLPEGFSYLGPESGKPHVAESLDGSGFVVSSVKELCTVHGVSIIAGGIIEKSEDEARPFNTSAVFDEQGQLVARYRKIHLFDVDLDDGTSIHESRATHPGSLPAAARIGTFEVGLSICYDIRFPELYAHYRSRGAEVLTVPSAFTQTTGRAHWHTLLRARAIENQCWVIAAAQEGEHPGGRKTFGHALIVDPWGQIVAERSEAGPGFVAFDIDHETVARVRRQIPVFSHRRPLH